MKPILTISTDYDAKPGQGRYLVTEEHKDGYRILARAETLQSARNFIAIEKHKRQGRKPGSKR
jgi:hypothetical protein